MLRLGIRAGARCPVPLEPLTLRGLNQVADFSFFRDSSPTSGQPEASMASGPHDIVSSADGSAVRYKVYPEKNRKAKIKLCVRFDPEDPKPEREWNQFRDDGDPEAAVRLAARRMLGGSAPTESAEAARAASERLAADRQAAAAEEARELQRWHAENRRHEKRGAAGRA